MSVGGIKEVVDADFYDSFSIGGIWTGTLTTNILDQSKLKAFKTAVMEKYGWPVENAVVRLTNDHLISEKQKKTLEIFLKYFPDFTGEPPFFRDEYAALGYEDDALFLTTEHQYYRLLNRYEGEWFCRGDRGTIEMINLSQHVINPENIIGKHWVVVLTCHR